LLTWNEAHGCAQDLPKIDFDLFEEVFALDGGSTDGTLELLGQYGITVVNQQKRSYNAAYIEALQHYSGDAIIFFHPKGTIDPSDLVQMREQLEQDVDLVIASRMLKASTNEEDDGVLRPRKWFGQALGLAAATRWRHRKGSRVTDPLHGFRGCSRKFSDRLDLRPYGVTADLEMVRFAYQNQAIVREFPCHESGREVGDSHFPAWSTGKQLIRYLVTG
jgi:glycosyltransferase involved in cell wall biosynthesis